MLILGGQNIESGELTQKVDVLTSKGICNFPYGYPPILPSARIGHSVAVSRKNGHVYLCGGYDPSNFRKSNGLSFIGQKQTSECFMLNLAQDWSFLNSNITWKTIPRLPIGVSHGTMVIVNNAIIVIGGYRDSVQNKGNLDTIQILKSSSRSSHWKISKHKYPLKVWGHCSVVRSTDGKIFSTGGISDGENSLNNLRSVYVTDGTSLQSRKLESRMKVGRATHACLATALKKYGEEFVLVVAGGITTTSHPETPTATVEVFLSSKDKWISMDNMMQPRSWYPSLVITNKRLACVGGKGKSNGNYITAEWFFRKEDKWKQIKAISSSTMSRYNARIVVVPFKTDHNFNICV